MNNSIMNTDALANIINRNIDTANILTVNPLSDIAMKLIYDNLLLDDCSNLLKQLFLLEAYVNLERLTHTAALPIGRHGFNVRIVLDGLNHRGKNPILCFVFCIPVMLHGNLGKVIFLPSYNTVINAVHDDSFHRNLFKVGTCGQSPERASEPLRAILRPCNPSLGYLSRI